MIGIVLRSKKSQYCTKTQNGTELNSIKNKILEPTIKKKDGRPKSIKGFKEEPKPTNG